MSHFGLNQTKIGDLLGYKHTIVSLWLSGKKEMPQSTAMAIGAALGIRWQWLLNGEGSMLLDQVNAHLPADLKELADLWPQLSEADRQYVLGVAEGRAAKKARS